MSAYDDLPPRRQRFVDALIANGGNQTQAALEAGYSPTAPDVEGSRLLVDARVSQAVTERRQELRSLADYTAVQWLTDVLELAKHPDWAKMPGSARVGALNLAGKAIGVLSERVDHRHLHAQLPEGLTADEIRELAGLGDSWEPED